MNQFFTYISNISNELTANEQLLNQLDGSIGDGDHGTNIVRGFKAIVAKKDQFIENQSIDKSLMICAQTLMSTVGGTSGALLATAMMKMAVVFKNSPAINNQVMASGLQAAEDGILNLGRTKLGNGTMLDAIHPTIEAFKNSNDSLNFKGAYEAALKGAQDTIAMKKLSGRASYLGDRSINNMDPGAKSISLIFKALSETK